MKNEFKDVTERFIKFVKIDTQSDENAPENRYPSTEKQKDLAVVLVEELRQAGAENLFLDQEYGYVYASIPASSEPEYQSRKVLGFLAHMDTSPSVSGKNVVPCIVKNYDGRPVTLSGSDHEQRILSSEDFPELKNYIGKDLITTDGTTLLGADDKAGVAEIMTMAVYLLTHREIRHGKIAIAFTPDEEVGAGTEHFDLKRFGADYAYTVDGAAFGEVEYETFNASSANVTINGINIHPGSAKGKMKNALRIAMEFNAMLPEKERPENTDHYEGFYHLDQMDGIVEKTNLRYLLRDHDRNKLEEKKTIIQEIAIKLNRKYGENTVQVEIRDSYYNMAEQIKPHWHLIETAYEAIKELGGIPCSNPARGGTDGSRLSFMGLPCPNLGTGSHNHHGKTEYACIQAMDQCVELLIKIAEKYSKL